MSDTSPPRGRLREHTARRIRVHLAERNMSAAELARRSGLKQPYVSRRMTGDTAFDIDDLEVIAAALGVKVTDLVADVSTDTQPTGGKLQVTGQRPNGAVRPTARGSAARPRDGRPNGRPAAQPTSPHTRRPSRVLPLGRAVASAA